MSSRRRRDIRRRNNAMIWRQLHVKCFTSAKLGEKTNADSYGYDLKSGRFVIADGVSRSFRPHLWSAHICNSFAKSRQKVSKRTLSFMARDFSKSSEPLTWNLEEMRDRGSHATMMVLDVRLSGGFLEVEAASIGDCLLVFISNDVNRVETTWPFKDAKEMPFATAAVSSVRPFLMAEKILRAKIRLKPGLRILMTTDAVARYLLSTIKLPHANVPFFESQIAFEKWADEMSKSELIENDDLTLLEISFDFRRSHSQTVVIDV